MHEFPHRYVVTATATDESDVSLSSPGLTVIPSAPPPQFGGPENRWSPESLLTAAVADCFVLSFRAIARASRFPWVELACNVEGVLDREDGQLRFTSFAVNAELVIAADGDVAKAGKLLHKAEAACLITNSLRASCHLTIDVSQT
jgi:organic hydroperoxide reductase OsmC/OhrA